MIVIDGNAIGFAATATNDLRSGTVQTGGVFGFLRTLRSLRETYNGALCVAWDAKSWRYDAFPGYKANRKVNPQLVAIKERWVPQRKLVAQVLARLGVMQLSASNMEADDLAARFCKAHATKDIVLITGDRDWLQLVTERVSWHDPIRDRRVTHHNFAEFTGLETPWQLVQAKALQGDTSDCIPGVGGLGEKASEFIFQNFGSVDAMLNEALIDRAAFDKLEKKYRAFVDDPDKIAAYHRNLLLVWLNHPKAPAAVNPAIAKGKFNRDAFIDLCGELAFHSILHDVDYWLKPFLTIS